MTKQTFEQTVLHCYMREHQLTPGGGAAGVLIQGSNGEYFRFVEGERRTSSHPLNCKLFNGSRISLVRMQNGLYQPHCKTFQASDVADPEALAYELYCQLLEAFTLIKETNL